MKKKEKLVNENPMLQQERLHVYHEGLTHKGVMTVSSTLKKSLCGLLVTLLSAAWIWFNYRIEESTITSFKGILLVVGISTFGLTLAVHRNPFWARYLIFPYAILKGILLGFISHMADLVFPGIAFQAFLGTFIVFVTMAFISVNNIIKVDGYFRKRLTTALFGLLLLYFIDIILHFTGIYALDNLMHGSGWISILFSVFVIGLASFCLLADMDSIKLGAKNGWTKQLEWYCAMSLLATVLWIYMEILRLLIKLNSRKK